MSKSKNKSVTPAIRPSLDGPFHALEAKEVNSKQTKSLVVTYQKAVCEGNFSVLCECNNWKDAVFLAYACNEVLGLCGIRFVIQDAKRHINRSHAPQLPAKIAERNYCLASNHSQILTTTSSMSMPDETTVCCTRSFARMQNTISTVLKSDGSNLVKFYTMPSATKSGTINTSRGQGESTNDMPTKFNIPARTEHRCEPCEHLKRTNMLCSRLHGITCDYVCKHPEAFDDKPLSDDPKIAAKQGEIRGRLLEHGRHIGKNGIQPNWCPLRRKSDDSQVR